MDTANTLPHVNAFLNTVTTLLLLIAFVLIRRKHIEGHRKAMIGALAVSTVFLASYLVYHFTAPIFVFRGEGAIRPVYFTILITHVVLAAVVLPMILVTAWRGLNRMDARHRAIARYTWPVWMYVSVSGVVIYWMLYHIYI